MTAPEFLQDDTILARTAAGQREVLEDSLPLDGTQRRMLLLVNGYTPLAAFAERVSEPDDLKDRVRALVDRGLVSQVDAATSVIKL